MINIDDLQAWHTIIELKEDHKKLGLKGWKYFIVDFPQNLTGEIATIISQPTFSGTGVGMSISSYVVTDGELVELFNVSDTTFKEFAKELERDYFKPNNNEE